MKLKDEIIVLSDKVVHAMDYQIEESYAQEIINRCMDAAIAASYVEYEYWDDVTHGKIIEAIQALKEESK